MSKPIETATQPAAPIKLEDLRHKALHIRDDVADEARSQMTERGTQIVLVGVVAIVVAVSFAYYVGTRAGRAVGRPPAL